MAYTRRPASGKLQQTTFNHAFDVFSNTRGDAHTGNRRRIDHRQFLNVVIWRYPIMLRQQMAEFHGEMPSAQSK